MRASLFPSRLCLLLCLLALGSCKLVGKRQPPAPAPVTSPAPAPTPAPFPDNDDLEVPLTLRALEGAAVNAGRDRAAVLITADRYKSRPTDDLPQLARGVADLRQALTAACSIPPSAIVEKSGASVIPAEIESAIAEFGKSAGGPSALLVVFYTGHGVIDAAGQLQLFTHHTDREGSTFTYTLPRADLLRWLAAARARAKDRGVDLGCARRPGRSTARARASWRTLPARATRRS
jgi:hypothetical protein